MVAPVSAMSVLERSTRPPGPVVPTAAILPATDRLRVALMFTFPPRWPVALILAFRVIATFAPKIAMRPAAVL